MRFEVPFNERTFRSQTDLQFKMVWKEMIRHNSNRLSTALGMFVLSMVFLLTNSYFGFLLLGIAFHYGVNFYNFKIHYKKEKEKYISYIEELIKKYEIHTEGSIWDFKDEGFYYKDFQFEIFIKWESFWSYKKRDNNLILIPFNFVNQGYILGEQEIGKENFLEVLKL